MVITLLAMLQAAASPADIELRATVRARSLVIEGKGDANLTITANGQNVIDIRAPEANGRKRISNPVVHVNVEARIADPKLPQEPKPTQPQ